MPDCVPRAPIQVTAVPEKLSVARAPGVAESSAPPALQARMPILGRKLLVRPGMTTLAVLSCPQPGVVATAETGSSHGASPPPPGAPKAGPPPRRRVHPGILLALTVRGC